MVTIERLDRWRGGSLFRDAVGAFFCATVMLVHKEARRQPRRSQRVIKVVPSAEDALIQVEERVPEPFLVISHALEQRTFGALVGEEADQRGGVDRDVVGHDAGAQAERLEQLAIHLFQHAIHVKGVGQVALGIGFRAVRQVMTHRTVRCTFDALRTMLCTVPAQAMRRS